MWAPTDYDELKTLGEVVADIGEDGLFGSIGLDDASKKAVVEWFNYRKVCDNALFVPFFQRKLNMNYWQYEQYLRVQSVEFDPMVAEYLERQVVRKGERSDETTRSTTTTNDLKSETDGSNTGTTSGKQTNALKTERTSGSENDSTVRNTGSDTTTVDTTVQGTGDIKVTDSGKGEKNTNGTAGHKALSGQLPQSSVNADGAFPENLNWQYLTQQDETKDNTSSTETDTRNYVQTTDRNTVDSTQGETVLTHDTTTTGHDEGSANETVDSTGTVSTDGTSQEKYNSMVKNTGTVTGEDKGSVASRNNDDTRERYTGRHESPQDMLDRARDYIMKTNAFNWLVYQLEPCFMGIYDI